MKAYQVVCNTGYYKIEDMSGKVVVGESSTEMIELKDEQIELKIPLEGISNGTYTLMIDAFVGGAKADQPLRIHGGWKVNFIIN